MLTFKEKYDIINKYVLEQFSFNQESFEKTFSVSLVPIIENNQDENIAILEYDFYFFSLEADYDYNRIYLIRKPNLNLDKKQFLAVRTLTKDQRITFNSLNEQSSNIIDVYYYANQCLTENNKSFISFIMMSHNFYFKNILNHGLQEQHIDGLIEFIKSEILIENF